MNDCKYERFISDKNVGTVLVLYNHYVYGVKDVS